MPSVGGRDISRGIPRRAEHGCEQHSTLRNSPSGGPQCNRFAGMCEELAENLRLHENGMCRPCVAFAFREGGCFKGEACSHCHFCTAEEAAERRKHLQSIARRRRRMRRLEAELNQEEQRQLVTEPGRIATGDGRSRASRDPADFVVNAGYAIHVQPSLLAQVPLNPAGDIPCLPVPTASPPFAWTSNTSAFTENFDHSHHSQGHQGPRIHEHWRPWHPLPSEAQLEDLEVREKERPAPGPPGPNVEKQSFWL